MTYAKKTLSEIKLIHGDYGNFIKGQKLDKKKEKKYKTPPYQDLAASNEIDGEPLDEKCWPGYEKKGMKTMFGKRYPNCVKKKKTRKEEYSDWRSELEENKEIDEARKIVKKFGKKTPPKGALATKALTKLGTKGRIAAGVLGAALAAPTIVSGIKGIIKRRKNAAIEKQVDKYVSDRKAPIKKVNYMPDNMYTVKRDKDGKVSGTGDKIRVVPGTRTTPKPTQPDNTKKSRFSQHTRMKLGNYGSLSPYDDAIDKQVDKYVKDRKVPVRKIKEEKKMTKAQIKKRDEIADAISTREMNKRYGDKNVKYAIATKLAMKEDVLDERLRPIVKGVSYLVRKAMKNRAKTPMGGVLAALKPTPKKSQLSQFAMYHGTSSKSADKIMKSGKFKKSIGDVMNPDGSMYTGKRAFATTDPKRAKEYADMTAKYRGGKPEVLAVKVRDSNIMNPSGIPDEYYVKTKHMKPVGRGVKPIKIKRGEVMQNSFNPLEEKLNSEDKPFVKKLVGKLRKGSKTHAKQADDLEKAMKENTAIENELVIQDWNVDDIKFTEIETVDIIKAKPLKENMSNWREELGEDWQKINRKDKTDGLSRKAVKAYRRENPGSKLQTAVTKDPKKLKKGSKSAKRRLSFCRRMKGMKKKLTSAKTRRDPDSRINKALRRWNC